MQSTLRQMRERGRGRENNTKIIMVEGGRGSDDGGRGNENETAIEGQNYGIVIGLFGAVLKLTKLNHFDAFLQFIFFASFYGDLKKMDKNILTQVRRNFCFCCANRNSRRNFSY